MEGKSVISAEDMINKLKAAMNARESSDTF